MKLHAPIGAEILSAIDFPYPVVPIVRHHHENWDGTGYPDRIAGTDIPIGARILSVVDCFDALTSDRPYRKRMRDEEALAILRERRGTMYDPLVVDVFSANYKRIMPADEAAAHPATKAVGGARQAAPASATESQEIDGASTAESGAINEVLTISSLARAVSGNASLTDVGALAWMTLRNVVPATAMALFVEDERQDLMTVAYAAGAHTADVAAAEESPRWRHRRLGRGQSARSAQLGGRARSGTVRAVARSAVAKLADRSAVA